MYHTSRYSFMSSFLYFKGQIYRLYLNHNVRKSTFGRMPSEDSYQPAHSRSLIRSFAGRILDNQGYSFFMLNKDSDLTVRLRRLILHWTQMSKGTYFARFPSERFTE